jgi:acetyltransferase-like isoleucine patch superfamily enzyme
MLRKWLRNLLGINDKPTMFYNVKFRGSTLSYSNTTHFYKPENLSLGNQVHIWHYAIIDGTAPITIGDGCQIGAWVGIFTHSSHQAIRLYGYHFNAFDDYSKKAYLVESVHIGAFTAIGPHCVVLPGSRIGKGCILKPHTIIPMGADIPDFSIVEGEGKITGDTRSLDKYFLETDPQLRQWYAEWLAKNSGMQ